MICSTFDCFFTGSIPVSSLQRSDNAREICPGHCARLEFPQDPPISVFRRLSRFRLPLPGGHANRVYSAIPIGKRTGKKRVHLSQKRCDVVRGVPVLGMNTDITPVLALKFGNQVALQSSIIGKSVEVVGKA